MIELINVTKTYPGLTALNDISMQVKRGSIHGLLGPNGAGKTTTMNIIANLTRPSSGQVIVRGRLGFLPEIPPLYSNMKVGEFLTFVAEINDCRKPDLPEVLGKCGLKGQEKRWIGNLSKGFRQRVGIASILIFYPEILILDEPTVGLDPYSIMEIRELILDLKKDHTIILSTHQLHEASLVCSDITILSKGRVLKSGSLAQIQQEFKARQTVKALVRDWKVMSREELLGDVKNYFPCENVEIKVRDDSSTELTFNASSNQDHRPLISQYLHQKNAGLLKFEEVTVDLEEIFLHSTKG